MAIAPLLTTKRPANPDDVSGHVHRQLIGYAGLLLPVTLVTLAWLRPTPPLNQLLDSLSAYYYSGATAAFVGLLVAIGIFLLSYRGYQNRYQWADRAAAITGGLSAFGVAFFPTAAPVAALSPPWWGRTTGVIHFTSAVILFAVFAVFSLWLFRISENPGRPTTGKRWRNAVYLGSGIAILGSMAWACIAHGLGRPIFLPETTALLAFSIAWLVKGYAARSIARTAEGVPGALWRRLRGPRLAEH